MANGLISWNTQCICACVTSWGAVKFSVPESLIVDKGKENGGGKPHALPLSFKHWISSKIGMDLLSAHIL